MKVTLISPANNYLNIGIRSISSFLKKSGHEVQLVFLPSPKKGFYPENKRMKFYNQITLEKLAYLCRDSQLVGLSLMTLDLSEAVEITEFLKKGLNVPIIWGGIHPTIAPEEAIRYCDILCLGDGECVLNEFIEKYTDGKDYYNIEGMWFRKDGRVLKNPIRPLGDNLDCYPFPDFDFRNKLLIQGDDIIPYTQEMMQNYFTTTSNIQWKFKDRKYIYTTLSSRGCPHQCAYCSNHLFLDMFKGKGKILRTKSVTYIINEILNIRKDYPFINFINFYDDDFFSRNYDEMVLFAKMYKDMIGLPFKCLLHPNTFSEEKLTTLIDAGLCHINMGIQSGSERINRDVYNRYVSNERMIEVITTVYKYKNQVTQIYDYIFDNPYETNKDKLDALKFFAQLPRPYTLGNFSLVLFPKTKLYERALRDGIFKSNMTGYQKSMNKNLNLKEYSVYHFMIRFSHRIPRSLFKILINRWLFYFFNLPLFNPIFREVTILFNKRKEFLNRITKLLAQDVKYL